MGSSRKTCTKCGKPKKTDEFSFRAPGVRRTICKVCVNEYSRGYYDGNKARHAAGRKASKYQARKRLTDRVREIKDRPCTDCKNRFPYYVMDLDHLDPKQKCFSIGNKLTVGISMARLEAELAKCEVVCANCHRIRTHGKRGVA